MGPATWTKPSATPLLAELLQLALTHRQSGDLAWLERLQREVDLLQQALDQQRAEERTRLERMKLAALAELAAGAGHEINNPLAVISGAAGSSAEARTAKTLIIHADWARRPISHLCSSLGRANHAPSGNMAASAHVKKCIEHGPERAFS